MKKLFILFLFALFVTESLRAQNNPVADINELLNRWHQAAAEADEDFYFGAMDEKSFFIGTDATEVWDKTTFYSLYLRLFQERESAWDFKTLHRQITLADNGEYAWFDETLDTWMGICRGSGVLQKKDNQWKIKQYVLSVAVDNEAIDGVIELHKALDKK